MTANFSLEMLPAGEGDCLWLTFGDGRRRHHLLIDGGRQRTGTMLATRLAAMPAGEQLDLVIVTHIDRDHIEGMLELVESNFYGVRVGDFWFNGRDHLAGAYVAQSAPQGERLSNALIEHGLPWNRAFKAGPVVTELGRPSRLDPVGGLELTLISPTAAKLAALIPVWDAEIAQAELKASQKHQEVVGLESLSAATADIETLVAKPFRADKTPANGTSIALLAEFAGVRLLLGADAHADLLVQALTEIGGGKPVALDAFKVPHHGSAKNISNALVEAVDCPLFLISTDGSYFGHPNDEAIARIIDRSRQPPTLVFNHKPEQPRFWDDPSLQKARNFKIRYLRPETGYRIDLGKPAN